VLRRVLLTALVVLAARAVAAHPAPFSYLDLVLGDDGVSATLTLHDLDAAHELGLSSPDPFMTPAGAEAYRDRLAAILASRLRIEGDGQARAVTFGALEPLPERQSLRFTLGIAGPRPGRVTVTATLFPYDPIHQTFVNVHEDGTLRHQAVLDAAHPTLDYYAGTLQGTRAVLATFIPAGTQHILIGPDHLLFLVALLLLGGTARQLVGIVTAFTVGHSVTLSLAALDLVTPPAWLVEPVIAMSIVLVAVDNLLVAHARDAAPDTPARDLRPWGAGLFGLVHGFGFAAVLREFGLPSGALGWSLFGFNLGVEVGQLAVVAVVATALAAVRRRDPTLARRVAIVGSVVVALAGTYWFVERVFFPT
jgi:hydrogenase/urease accessory protein HupE